VRARLLQAMQDVCAMGLQGLEGSRQAELWQTGGAMAANFGLGAVIGRDDATSAVLRDAAVPV